MSLFRVKPPVAALTRGVLVWLLAATVFALGLLGAAPSAHNRLHGHDDDHASQAVSHDDTGCAITLFAHGATTPLELPRIIAPRPVLVSRLISEPDSLLLTSQPHLTPPGCGPPDIG